MSTKEQRIKPLSSFIDESFDEKSIGDYVLLIELSAYSFTYAVLDTKKQKYIILESYDFKNLLQVNATLQELEIIVNSNKRLRLPYNSVKVNWITQKSTLFPSPLFEKDKKVDYLKFNHLINNDELIYIDHLKNIEAVVVYSMPALISDKVKQLFKNVFISHFSSSLLENLYIRYKNQEKSIVVVHMQPSHFEIIVFKEKKFIFYNSYKNESSEDFMYFLLASCEQLKLNPEELQLVLCGEIEKNSPIYSILKQYIRNVGFVERPENYKYGYQLNSMPGHFYFNIFNQDLVEITGG